VDASADAPGADASLTDSPVAPDAAGDSSEASAPPPVLSAPSHGSTIALTDDDTRLVMANHDTGTATVFAVDYSSSLPVLSKLAEIPVGAEPSGVVVHPDGDTAFVLARKDQKLVKITGLKSTPSKAAEVSVGSEPTGLALTPLGTTVWVANWVDGTLMGIQASTMTVAQTVDLNAALAASPYLGTGVTSRPALAHPRAVAITNNGDMYEKDESIYVAEFFAQQKEPLANDASNADTARVGVLYKVPLATMAPSLIEIPALTDMGFQDHNGGTAGCFPNQLQSINIQGAFGYVTSTCASPKPPIGVFNGPPFASCKLDSACPGAAVGSCASVVAGTCSGSTTTCRQDSDCPGAVAGSCVGVVAGTCKTNCNADALCGKNGGHCTPTSGTDPTVGGVCAPNPADVRTATAPAVSIIDLGGNKTIATVNLAQTFSAYFDSLKLPDDATRRFPLLPADIGFVPGTLTAYFPAMGADAVFRVDFDATYASTNIDSVGSPKNPFITVFSEAIDPSRNGQLPSGIAVAHTTHTPSSMLRYAFVANNHTRNVTVLDLDAQEIAGLSAGTPTTATASAAATDPTEIENLEGRRLFITGLGRWSWNGQAWQGCSNCHADGLTDNVTWYAGRGPRQSPSLDGSFVKGPSATNTATDYRVNSWEGVQDEIADHEGAIRSFSGGVGAIVKSMTLALSSQLNVAGQTGLNGSSLAVADPANPESLATPSVLDNWKTLVAWARQVRSPRRPTNLDPAKVASGQALFTSANCQGCHGGPLWTISQVFYTPDPTGAINNQLKTLSWSAAVQQANFPPNLLPVANGLPATGMSDGQLVTYSGQTMRYSGNKASLFDQLTCAMRSVGTYGVAQAESGIAELRTDLVTPSQGGEPDSNGFNPPPLLNALTGAPYFHAGNALTLEALFSPTFQAHYQALAPGFLAAGDPARADKVASLIQFILSIDPDTSPIAIPPLGPNGGSFCASH